MIRTIQLGKGGITENFIDSLENQFKSSRIIKISVLKSATRDRKELTEIKDALLEKLEKTKLPKRGQFRARIIGFTIVLRKR